MSIMSLYVLKFGGSSVANIERMKHVSNIIAKFIYNGHSVVVVTSAMKGVTNNLVTTARQISIDIDREYDAIISTGELVAAGMLARTLQTTGIPAVSLSASQIPIYADGSYGNGKVTHIKTSKLLSLVNDGVVPVVTGFQGITNVGDVITLGRGGSDATACALTYFLDADECFIYTDVEGVFTADPHIALNAQLIPEISYDEMLELSFWGAKVLQYQSVEIAKKYNIKVRVLSSFTNGVGTLIQKTTDTPIFGIAHSSNYNLVTTDTYNTQFIKVAHNLYLVPKDIEINGDIDVDIGTVTVVGFKTNMDDVVHNICVPHFVIRRDLSTTYIVQQSKIEHIVNAILDAKTTL